jgi:hypothetical protein
MEYYDRYLPAHIVNRIGQAIAHALERMEKRYPGEVEIHRWLHGLPVWVVTRKQGDRVNLVRVELVSGPLGGEIRVLADAYEDKVAYEDDKAVVHIERMTPSAEDVSSKGNFPLSFGTEWLYKLPPWEVVESSVFDTLEKALDVAAQLPLTEQHVIEYATPFRTEGA